MFIVSDRHIDHLVTAIVRAELLAMTPDEIGRMLWNENLESAKYRYPGDTDGNRPGPIDFRDRDVETYTWQETAELPPERLHATLAGYQYQACEHPGWAESEAYQVTAKLRQPLKDAGVVMDDEGWDWPGRAYEAKVEREAQAVADDQVVQGMEAQFGAREQLAAPEMTDWTDPELEA
jgi:hypothetical protein